MSGMTAIGSWIGAGGAIADHESTAAAKEAVNANSAKLKLAKAGHYNALSLI